MGHARILALLLTLPAACACAQGPLGSVAAAEADVTNPHGTLQVVAGRVGLSNGSVVVARDRTAHVRLGAGEARVCRTSSLHLAGAGDALLLALDRGALEIERPVTAADVVLTPDLRMTFSGPGQLDLRLRVTPNGDTCVENRGRKAPTIRLTDAFGDASYQVAAGQHVLFEHGSLREVVDRETTPCGCPPDDAKPVPLADALLLSPGAKVTPAQAAAANPFPTAQSEGLAAPPPVPAQPAGGTHVQVATTLSYDPAAPAPTQTEVAQSPAMPTADTHAPSAHAPDATPVSHNPLTAIGRFFKRIFVR